MTAYTLVFRYKAALLTLACAAAASIAAALLLGEVAPIPSLAPVADGLARVGVWSLFALFAMAFVPDAVFAVLQSLSAPWMSLRRLAQVKDTATSRLRSAAQGQVEVEAAPLDDATRAALGLRDPDYFDAFRHDDHLVFVFYPDRETGGSLQDRHEGPAPVLVTGFLQTRPTDRPLDLRRRPFALSMRIARRLWRDKNPAAALGRIELAEIRLREALRRQGHDTMALVTADPLTGRGVNVYAGGEAPARRLLTRRALLQGVRAAAVAGALWWALAAGGLL